MIDPDEIAALEVTLRPLIGQQFDVLSLPEVALPEVEPSAIGTMVGTLMDALLPQLPGSAQVGLSRHPGTLGQREGYPDYLHSSGKRLELKLLYVDNPDITTKKPPTLREPSARLTQKVTVKNVVAQTDLLLVIAYRLERSQRTPGGCSPTIIDLGLFPMHEVIAARDERLTKAQGKWFGDYETPAILSNLGRQKLKAGQALDATAYGRKKAEQRDYNEDTNFGKLSRIPQPALQAFLKKHGLRVVELVRTPGGPKEVVKDGNAVVEIAELGEL